jgi:hypothetical protein
MSDYCLSCGTELHHYDTGSDCLRCEAEQAHDYDIEPNVEFDRCGSMIDTVEVDEAIHGVDQKLVADELVELYEELTTTKADRKISKRLDRVCEELALDRHLLSVTMDNVMDRLDWNWETAPLDADQTKELAKLFRLYLDRANGNI